MAVNGQFDAKHIADVLSTFGCKISAKDLKHPTYELILPIYKIFLETCICVTPVLYETEPIDALLHFSEETIKSQAQSFQQIMLYGYLSFLLDICGLEVPMSDILCTNKKLIIKQLSNMINFAKFEGEELKAFHEIQDANHKFEEECGVLKHTIDELNSKSYYLRGERAQKEESVQARKAEIARLKEHICTLGNDFKLIKQHERSLEQEEAELEKQKAALQSRLSQCERKSKILERLIVKSPTRLVKECEKTDSQCADLEGLINSKNSEIECSRRLLFEKEKFGENCSIVETIVQDFYAQDIVQANEYIRQIDKISQEITNSNFESNKIESAYNTLKSENEKSKKALQDIISDSEQKSFQIDEKEKETNEYD